MFMNHVKRLLFRQPQALFLISCAEVGEVLCVLQRGGSTSWEAFQMDTLHFKSTMCFTKIQFYDLGQEIMREKLHMDHLLNHVTKKLDPDLAHAPVQIVNRHVQFQIFPGNVTIPRCN